MLRNSIIQKRLDFFKANGEENSEASLLQTIRVPKNLLFLTDRLPQANYEKIPPKKNLSFQNNSLPDVKIPPSSKQKKIKRGASPVHEEDRKPERENSPKSRNVVSLPSNKNDEIEILKRKLRINDEKTEDASHKMKSESELPNKDLLLPNIKGGSSNKESSKEVAPHYDIKYDPSPKKREEPKKKGPRNPNPYLHNEHVANVYQIYSPYLKNPVLKKPKYEDKQSKYLKQLEKYYEYNLYKPKKNVIEPTSPHLSHGAHAHKIIPNRKLSPIGGKKQMIKI